MFKVSIHSSSLDWTAMGKKRLWVSLLGKLLTREFRSRLGANGWLTPEDSQEVRKLEVTLDMAPMRRLRAR